MTAMIRNYLKKQSKNFCSCIAFSPRMQQFPLHWSEASHLCLNQQIVAYACSANLDWKQASDPSLQGNSQSVCQIRWNRKTWFALNWKGGKEPPHIRDGSCLCLLDSNTYRGNHSCRIMFDLPVPLKAAVSYQDQLCPRFHHVYAQHLQPPLWSVPYLRLCFLLA